LHHANAKADARADEFGGGKGTKAKQRTSDILRIRRPVLNAVIRMGWQVAAADGGAMSRSANRTTAGPGHRTEILSVRGELDLATAGSLYRRGHAAIGRHTRLLLLDLTGLFFCDASGLTAFVRIANEADAAGCRYGLIAPQPPVAKMLRITGLHQRLHVYATIDQARQHPTPLTATAPSR
jgi:anti-sigma B factor antagonist